MVVKIAIQVVESYDSTCFPCFSDPVPSSKRVLAGSMVNHVLARKSIELVHLQHSKFLLLDVDVRSGNWNNNPAQPKIFTHPQISFEAAGTLTFAEGVTTTSWCDASVLVVQCHLWWWDASRIVVQPCPWWCSTPRLCGLVCGDATWVEFNFVCD